MNTQIFKHCQELFPEWASLSINDFTFDKPKGFSSFTMGIRAKKDVDPPAILYRRLEGKENAILDFETEKQVFLTLGKNNIAAHCHYYDNQCRFESFHQGRSLYAEELFEADNLKKIANELYRFHHLERPELPNTLFFELMHHKWGNLAKKVLQKKIDVFPDKEQILCEQLREIYSPETLEKVREYLPDGELDFCHNDTYHGNIMKLETGEIKLVDFEFSCLNHKAYDFSNMFAETVMKHQQPAYPYFKIVEPEYGEQALSMVINYYLDNEDFENQTLRGKVFQKLLTDTKKMLVMSDYKYAMAAIPLAVNPVQKIRFIPYAYQRYKKFLKAIEADLF
ncbi:MAG: phosphotransferase [Gammaproteobacteria bacterium]|nr:phosphotransferase [Gammaproteobacteria bacterium]